MSSRVLRKLGLQGEKEIGCINDDASDTEADISSSSGAKKKQLNINRYDLLNQQSHSESEVKEDDDHETAGSLEGQEAVDLKDLSRRKKKKKKKKTGKVPNSNPRSSEDNVEDEVERSVREVNEILGVMPNVDQAHQVDTGSPSLRKGVLTVEHRALNPNNELRRIFGAKILQNEIQVKKRGRNRGHLKSTFLVTPKENWPPIGKPGLSMKLIETKNGVSYFAYEHSLNYQQVQMRFLEAVESLNPDNIVYKQIKTSASIIQDVGRLLSEAKVLIFLVWCIGVGMCTAMVWNFLFWFLEDLATDCDTKSNIKTLEGLAMVIQCLCGELPFFFLSGWVLKKIGHIHAMSMILFAFGVRFLLYSILTNPWWVLPIELFNGITFGMAYATMASYASIVAPPGTEATTQGLVGAIFEGLGVSAGSFLGGFLFNKMSGSAVFRIFGISAIICCIVHGVIQYLLSRKNSVLNMHEKAGS